MVNNSPTRFVRIAAPNRRAALGLALAEALGRVERRLPEAMRRMLRRLDPADPRRPE